ncbi:MAG: FAD-binding oxidoreductase, partial [Eudoraea sp.]|nr:FAD-binding oxidoreductase [Eudoraea sp.]
MDNSRINILKDRLSGELLTDDLSRMIYSTDASVYRKTPLAVAYPKSNDDLKELISFASESEIGLVPRTAGTSLAGQCVGDGIIVDVSRYSTEILKLDPVKKQVTVQPGVVRDELN